MSAINVNDLVNTTLLLHNIDNNIDRTIYFIIIGCYVSDLFYANLNFNPIN